MVKGKVIRIRKVVYEPALGVGRQKWAGEGRARNAGRISGVVETITVKMGVKHRGGSQCTLVMVVQIEWSLRCY